MVTHIHLMEFLRVELSIQWGIGAIDKLYLVLQAKSASRIQRPMRR
jgi:hypothetical protein